MSAPVVTSPTGLEVVLADLRHVIDLSARLPQSPFKQGGTDSVCEFERFRGGDFGAVLAALAKQYNDEYVSGASIHPDSDYYEDFYETYGAFRIPSAETEFAYWDALSFRPNDDVTGALMFSADVLCVAGSSGRWGIWGEREIGVAVVRSAGPELSWRQQSDLFVSPEAALRDFIEPNFNREPLPAEFREAFLCGFTFADVSRPR